MVNMPIFPNDLLLPHDLQVHLAQNLSYLPNIVIDGLSLPSLLNNGGFSILANGLFGSGSLGVPSTRDHLPIVEPRPTINKSLFSCFSI